MELEGAVPPLWLRRHTGRLSDIADAQRGTDELFREWTLVREGDRVLDAGCGFGVLAGPLSRRFGPKGRYLGFDLHGPSIRWAQRSISSADRRFRFVLTSPESRDEGRFPAPDGEADFVLAKSFFTHLPEPAARRAFEEIARTLAPDGRALVTAFLFEASHPPLALFPYPDAGSPVRWRWKSRPEAAIAFERVHFTRMLEEAGLAVEIFRPGFWPRADGLNAQDVLLVSHAGAPNG